MSVSEGWERLKTSIAAVPIWGWWLGGGVIAVIVLVGTIWSWMVPGIIAAAVLASAAWWWVPKWQMKSITAGDPKARADIEDNFRKTVGQAVGGIAVLLTGISAYLQFTQQQNAAHDLLISNQVVKGFEQLASDKATMRLGGIYALEGVMNTSTVYHQPVLEALCTFVHNGTIDIHLTTDIQAALTVIGRRAHGRGEVDLTKANISGANLTGADLRGAILIRVNLRDAILISADLRDAILISADLRGAHLFNADLTGAHLFNADLTGANLRDAILSFADLRDAILIRANLRGAHLFNAHLTGANLSGANLSGADLSDADLSGADLSGADLTRANLSDAILSGANLSGAFLRHASLSDTKLVNANLNRAHLGDAHLGGAILLDSQVQLDQACGKPADLPDGLKLDKPCPPR